MTQTEKNFIALLRLAVGLPACVSDKPDGTISELAERHGVSNLLYYGVKRLPPELQPSSELVAQWRKAAFGAAARDTLQEQELAALFEAAEANGIDLLPLKGAEIKALYPQPDMRYMSDTDLLIQNAHARKLRKCLSALGYRCVRFGAGDTDLYLSPMQMNYEVHRDLSKEGITHSARDFLADLMDAAVPLDGFRHVLTLPPEEHYVYVLCHMAKHLRKGGIGVRAVLDLAVCRRGWQPNPDRLNELLDKLCLRRFADTAQELADLWFGEDDSGIATTELGEYILHNAVFGTETQRVLDQLVEQPDAYLFHRLFPPYREMSYRYPVLKKHKVLLPFIWCRRIVCTGLFQRKKLAQELAVYRSADGERLRSHADFLRRCGLFDE